MNNWTGYKLGNIYEVSQLAMALDEAFQKQDVEIVEKNKVQFFNIPASFDIETSSFIAGYDEHGEEIKAAIRFKWHCYIW